MIDQSSASRFSTGVPVSATRCAASQPPDRLGCLRQAVLHRLRLVEHDPMPVVAGELVDVAGGRGIGGDHQVDVAARRSRSASPWQPRPAVVRVDPQPGRELGGLPLPVADQGHRAQQQGGSGIGVAGDAARTSSASSCTVLPSPMSSARQAPEPERGQERQPGQPALLVGAQRGDEPGRRVERPRSTVLRRRRAGRPASRRRAPSRPAAGVSRSSGWLAASARISAAVLRPGRLALEELQSAAQLLGVDGHPLAAQPDQRGLGLGECVDLVLGERVVADGELPPEVHQLVASEPARPVTTPSTGVEPDRTRPSLARRSHQDGSSTPNPASSSSDAALDRKSVGAVGVEVERGRGGRAEGADGQRGVDPAGPARARRAATPAGVPATGCRLPSSFQACSAGTSRLGSPWTAAGTPAASRPASPLRVPVVVGRGDLAQAEGRPGRTESRRSPTSAHGRSDLSSAAASSAVTSNRPSGAVSAASHASAAGSRIGRRPRGAGRG